MSSVAVERCSNGVNLIYKFVNSPISHCCVMVDIGSRDEKKGEEGIAHFWEHMAFKGTQKRKSYQIVNYIDDLGGELNAYTTKEKICFYVTVLNEHIYKGINILLDIVFNAVFPEKEIEKERGVILEEMRMYKDLPDDMLQDEFDAQIFGNHALGHAIIGNENTIKKFKRDDFFNFLKSNLNTERIVLSYVGGVRFNNIKKLVFKQIESIPCLNGSQQRVPFYSYKPQHNRIEKPYKQVHCAVGATAYSIRSEHRIPFALLTNLLGGNALNARLNIELREKRGWVYQIESFFHPFTDTGVFGIFFGTEKKNFERCVDLIFQEFKKITTGNFSENMLKKYKQQFIGQMAIAEERSNVVMFNMARSFLDLDTIENFDSLKKQVENVSKEQLIACSSSVLNVDNISTLAFLPENH